jgi:hypothetical protein
MVNNMLEGIHFFTSPHDVAIFIIHKAIQSFDPTTDPMAIQNGIFLGDFAVLKFFGDFEFDFKKCKVRKAFKIGVCIIQ